MPYSDPTVAVWMVLRFEPYNVSVEQTWSHWCQCCLNHGCIQIVLNIPPVVVQISNFLRI